MFLKGVFVSPLLSNGMAECQRTFIHEPISALDIVATAAASAGVLLPTDRVFDGLNLIPFFTGEQT